MKDVDTALSLTSRQSDIYYDQVKLGDCPIYNVGGYIKLPSVCVKKITESHRNLVESIDVFGLRVNSEGLKPSLYFCSTEKAKSLPVIDLSYEKKPVESAQLWLNKHFNKPFYFDGSELFEAHLLKVSDSCFYYVGKAHHIIMDGWGFANWSSFICKLYNGEICPFEQIPSWKSVVEKGASYLKSKKYSLDREYWSGVLNESIDEESFTPRKVRKFLPSKRLVTVLDKDLVSQIGSFCIKNSISKSQFYLGALYIYESLYKAKTAPLIGLLTHNRSSFKEKLMMGVYTNIWPVIMKVDEQQGVVELCQNLNRNLKKAFRHQKFSYGNIVELLNEKVKFGQSLYEIGFNYLSFNHDVLVEGKKTELIYLHGNYEQTPLLVNVWDNSDSVELQLDYNLGNYCDQDIVSFQKRYVSLLWAMISPSLAQLKDLELVTQEEKVKLSQAQVSNLRRGSSLLERFEKLSEESPTLIAVKQGDLSITYGELNSKSNQIARLLQTNFGVRQEYIVGIHLSRNIDLIAYILAVIKAGAVYLPLEPSLPVNRLEEMIVSSNTSLVISDGCAFHNSVLMPDSWLNIEDSLLNSQLSRLSDAPFSKSINKDSLAYVIFTSGSTGKPKGVEISHNSVNALIDWAIALYDKDLSAVIASTAISFDLSIFEFFVPLSYGGKILLVDNVIEIDDRVFNEATLLNTVPSAISALLQNPSFPSNIKTINLAGELLHQQKVDQLYSRKLARVFDLYGPSEDTVYSTFCLRVAGGQQSIGKPLPNKRVLLLNRCRQLLPHGTVGEIYIGGAGLARGYLNLPELTAERFIVDPYNNTERLYRTGDLGRYDEQGNLQYLGRIDDQIKLRGHRIELGEIEQRILSHAQVEAALVVVKGESRDSQQLIAYVVSQENGSALAEALLCELEQQLPKYMVPAYLLVLPTFPLTVNGKIDKKALPLPSEVTERKFIAPKTKTEQMIVQIWSELLGIDYSNISRTDNFFSLGGNSLLAVRLAAKIREKLKKEIDIASIFKLSTILSLGEHIDVNSATCSVQHVPAISITNRQTQKLSFSQQRLWLIDKLQGGNLVYNMPAVFRVSGQFDCAKAAHALQALMSRHEI
ncbi:non-ribosomal peptide synthetase, partial [Pseudoalteromonas rhizosphaerae]|uniref:non-ribosomal peptide synthetase n=1 Tax=Pseudoalteromonas rhizosphaerae TaxID=2518973 RepID=UPI00384E8715